MKILFTICGRAGSKGIKNKNLKTFCGIPLVHYSLSAIDLYLKDNNVEYDIVANSDSIELLNLISSNKMREVEQIVRGKSLAGDVIGKIHVIYDCMIKMQEKKGYEYDVVVDLDITSPLRQVYDLRKVIDWHIKTCADVTSTVAPARRNPYFNQLKKTEHGFKKVCESDYTARQQAPEIYDMNASIYAYKPAFLRSGKSVLDGYCEMIEMFDTGILDLDHENDFELMEVIAEYLYKNNDNFRQIRENIQMSCQ